MGYAITPPSRDRQRTQYVTPQEKSSLMAELGQRSGQAIEALSLILDTPGAITRGLLAGDPLSGFSFDRERRVTGEELLDSYGLKPQNPYFSTPVGFAAELALDPLAYASFALKAGGQAAAAASKAGILKNAPYLASLKAGSEATRTGKYTLSALEKAGLKPTTSVLQTRPLIGPRLAQATTTLDELVRGAPDPADALQRVRNALGNTPYASVKDQRVGGLFGLSNPFTGQGWAYNPNMYAGKVDDLTNLNAAEKLADMLDRVGAGVAWSYPARVASSALDKAVGGEIDVAGQITAMRRFANEKDALRAGRSEATLHAMRLQNMQIPDSVKQSTGVNDFFSPEGADSLLRIIEGKPVGNDTDLLRGVAGLDDWVVEWRDIAKNKLAAARSLGLKSAEFKDPLFRTFFSPRSAPELDIPGGTGPVSSSLFSANIQNQYSRNPDLYVPGGTYQLQEISLDPTVRAWMKGETTQSEGEIGQYIAQLIGNPLVDAKQGAGIARVFREVGKDVPDNVPVFGTHPLIEQMSYIINEELRRSNAESAFEAIADAVVIQNGRALRASEVPGGRHIPVTQALQEIGDRIGLAQNKKGFVVGNAQQRVKDLIAQQWFAQGTNPAGLRLSQLTVPRELVERITRVHDFYASPKVQQEVGGMLSKFTTIWKASILAWPSRFVRDFYSNVFSLWVETGNANETLKGLIAGSKILNNQYDELMPYFRAIPRYAALGNISDQALINQVKLDVGSTGILSGLASADLLSANRRGDVGQFVPGSTPISISRSLAELRPQSGVSVGQRLQDFVTVKGVTNEFETRNPIFNASNMLGDTIDSTGRLGGFFALMRLGVAPEEAARRMMRSLVDYSSLTPFERKTIRNIAPWWAYWSRTGKYVVDQLVSSPGGRYAQTLRAVNDAQATTDQQYIPTSLRQRFALRLPTDRTATGGQTYLTDIDIPGVDILNTVRLGYQPDTLGSVLQTGQETLGEVFNQANPLIRTGAELLTNRDFFSKRPLDQAVTPLDTIYRSITGDKYARINPLIRAGLSTAISAVPLGSRGVSAVAQAVDARVPNVPFRLVKTLVNNLSGVKIQTVDPEFEALDALTKIRAQLSPYSREFVQSYIPKELLPNIPQESQQLDALSRELQRDLRELYQRRYGR